MDIVDEALATFKANVFFRNYEIEGEADLVLIYLTLYIQDCLQVRPAACFVGVEAGVWDATCAV